MGRNWFNADINCQLWVAIIIDSGLKSFVTDEPAIDYREIGEDFLTYYWPALIDYGTYFSRLSYRRTCFSKKGGCGR